jgi:hypothetical protein
LAAQRPTLNHTVPDPDIINTIRTIDDIFIRLAENQPLRQWVLMRAPVDELDELPIDDAVEEMWTALESGCVRLTGAGRRLHVAPFVGTKAERQRLARAHRPIIAARRRVLCGLYEAPIGGPF